MALNKKQADRVTYHKREEAMRSNLVLPILDAMAPKE